MKVKETDIKGVYIIEPNVHNDERGYFFESFNKCDLNVTANVLFDPMQDNESKSKKGVLRGLHFQTGTHAQAKLVRVIQGSVYDVAVDLRPDSETYGKYVGVELTGENQLQFFIPKGFAHGFVVTSDEAIFQYKCDEYWNPTAEDGIAWDSVDIPWEKLTGLKTKDFILSEKDKNRKTLAEYTEELKKKQEEEKKTVEEEIKEVLEEDTEDTAEGTEKEEE